MKTKRLEPYILSKKDCGSVSYGATWGFQVWIKTAQRNLDAKIRGRWERRKEGDKPDGDVSKHVQWHAEVIVKERLIYRRHWRWSMIEMYLQVGGVDGLLVFPLVSFRHRESGEKGRSWCRDQAVIDLVTAKYSPRERPKMPCSATDQRSRELNAELWKRRGDPWLICQVFFFLNNYIWCMQ
jgi:hypothetical protein